MRQAPALGYEHGVLQSPKLVLPETPLQQKYQPVFAVQTVGAAAQTSLAADMKLGTTLDCPQHPRRRRPRWTSRGTLTTPTCLAAMHMFSMPMVRGKK
jgi:hypothetical protein